MRALVSGQAGQAVIFEGGRVFSLDVANRCRIERTHNEWPYLINDASDVCEFNDLADEEIVKELLLAWQRDRSLHLVLTLLDLEASREARMQSATLLEEFVADERIFDHILNRLHVAALPASADLDGALKFAKGCPKTRDILGRACKGQGAIKRCRQAWDVLPPDLFGSSDAKEAFGFEAVQQGLFTALSSGVQVDQSKFSGNGAEVVRRWRREIKSIETRLHGVNDASPNPRPRNVSKAFARIGKRFISAPALGFAIAASLLIFVLIQARPVAAVNFVQIGPSGPGAEVVHASSLGLRQELHGRFGGLIPLHLQNSSKVEAERLFNLGEAYSKSGKPQDAAKAFGASNISYPTLSARLNQAVALLNRSELAKAEQLLVSLLPEADRAKTKLWKSALLTNLGHIYRTQGFYDKADQKYNESRLIDHDSGYVAGEAVNANGLARVLEDRGLLIRALVSFKSVLALSEQAGLESSAADARVEIAGISNLIGNRAGAADYYNAAAKYYENQGSPLSRARYYLTSGDMLYYSGKFKQSTDRFVQARDLYRSVSNKSGEAQALFGVGKSLQRLEQLTPALDSYQEAFAVSESIGDRFSQVLALSGIGSLKAEFGAYDQAISISKRSLAISEKIGAYGGQSAALSFLGWVMVRAGRPGEALTYYKRAIEIAAKSGDAYFQADAAVDLGRMYEALNQPGKAIEELERADALLAEIGSDYRGAVQAEIAKLRTASQN